MQTKKTQPSTSVPRSTTQTLKQKSALILSLIMLLSTFLQTPLPLTAAEGGFEYHPHITDQYNPPNYPQFVQYNIPSYPQFDQYNIPIHPHIHQYPPQIQGSGTAAYPFQIQTPLDLIHINNQILTGGQINNTNPQTAHFILTSDINLTDISTQLNNPPFAPFQGIGSSTRPFMGTFNGNNHTITLNITSHEDNIGLFRRTQNSTIINLQVSGNITGNSTVGGLIGAAQVTTVENITINASVSGNQSVGGIIGNAGRLAIIRNSQTTHATTVNGTDQVGGIIGLAATPTVEDTIARGTVQATGQEAGAIIGRAGSSTIINVRSQVNQIQKSVLIANNQADPLNQHSPSGIPTTQLNILVGTMEPGTLITNSGIYLTGTLHPLNASIQLNNDSLIHIQRGPNPEDPSPNALQIFIPIDKARNQLNITNNAITTLTLDYEEYFEKEISLYQIINHGNNHGNNYQGYNPHGNNPQTQVQITLNQGQITLEPIPPDTIPPIARGGFDFTIPVGIQTTFDGSDSSDNEGITSFLWNFGDGHESEAAVTTHQFNQTGYHYVTLTVTDRSDNTDTDTIRVRVVGQNEMGRLRVLVTCSETNNPIPNAAVYGEFPGGSEILRTNQNGEVILTTVPGRHRIAAFKQDYMPNETIATVDMHQINTITIQLDPGEIVIGDITHRQLTLAEIEAAGIDVYDPANQVVYNITVSLYFHGRPLECFDFYSNEWDILSDPVIRIPIDDEEK